MAEQDWEAMSRARLERLVAVLVHRIQDTASEIERESKQHLASAEKGERDHEFQTYPRVIGLISNKLAALTFNTHLDNLIDAAADAEKAHDEKQGASE